MRYRAISTVRAQCSGVLPSPPRAWTSDGSRVDELAQPIEHPEVRGREDVDDRAARDQRRRLLGRAVVLEQAESARPPGALEVEIGAVREQHVEQRQVLPRDRGRPAVEVADRLVDGGPHLGVRLEQSPDFACVAGVQRCEEFLSRRDGQRMAPPTLDVQSVPLVTENVL